MPPSSLSFASATNFRAGTGSVSVAIGDFNGDGTADLVTANGNNNAVSVLLSTGSGSFAPASSFGVGARPQSVAIGDFNGDGRSEFRTLCDGSD